MQWKNTHKIRLCAMLFAAMLALPASAEGAMGWYCVRNKAHKQPQLGSDLTWVEQFDGYWIDSRYGDETEEKVLYLTFDAGYENGNVERILNTLKEKDVPGAFFILGNLIERNPELVRRMASEGHTVCNHTYGHPDMTKMQSKEAFAEELRKLEGAYFELIGEEIARFYRPPQGTFDRQNMEWAHELGYKTIFWSFAYADWDNAKQPDPEKAKQKILDNIHNGAVLLLHPTSAVNAAIIGDVIDTLKADGWRFGTLDELTAEAK